MGRRTKPAKAKVEGARPAARKLPTSDDARVRDLENRLAEALEQVQARNRDLSEALERQTATSEILRVISASPTDVQPVFDAIVRNAVTLCGAAYGILWRYDGGMVHIAGIHNIPPAQLEEMRSHFPRPIEGADLHPLLQSGNVINISDIEVDEGLPIASIVPRWRARGVRSVVVVPLRRDAQVVGAIGVSHRDVAAFSPGRIELLKTFGDQAVIAIENVRLFTELGLRNRDLTESLEQQTATSEILRVISSSPTDVQPVFDVIVERAVRLCGARFGRVYSCDGDVINMVAGYGLVAAGLSEVQRVFPRPVSDDTVVGRVIRTRHLALIRDIERAEGVPALSRRMIDALETRSQVTVPMLRAGEPIGAMTIGWAEPDAFDEQQITLLETFADQAVIAIENVRLFTELQEKNRALMAAHAQVSESLEQQTATSEILRVISSSPTDTQPVFDAIVTNAARLCDARDVFLVVVEDDALRAVAATGQSAALVDDYNARRVPISRGSVAGRTIVDRATMHVPDLAAASAEEFPEGRAVQRLFGHRTMLATPLLRDDVAVGAIVAFRFDVRLFSERQIALLQTFADQAVIAIENVRLFKELEARTQDLTRSVGELRALGEVGQAISSTLDLETVLTTIVSRAVQLSGLDGGVVFEYDAGAEEFVQRVATETDVLSEARRTTRIRKGEGVLGRTAITLEPVQVRDITVPGAYAGRLRETLIDSGVRAILAVPMVREGQLIGCLGVTRNRPGEFPAETIELLQTFATQSALAIQNARLFQEIEDKSRQLEAASQHKSEFLANMSHELRTPLNAILGFSEILAQGMFGAVNEKQTEYLRDILESGRHLLSLINDILDLSKIEAGRMELEVSEFDLPQAIQNALTLVRERALRRRIALQHVIDDGMAAIRADERKVKQVLLNLLSNAIKFTPEGGRIEVRALSGDGLVEVCVIDTGIGIAAEDLEAVFEEFRQVGAADKKAEGTGLGLALAKKFVELHGGRIWVESEVGRGSTFTFVLPVDYSIT